MNRSTPGLPVHHQLLEFTQTRVHWVGDAIQPSHPLSSPSLPALNLSQHQGLFQWVSSSHQVAKVLEFHLQHQSNQWTPRTDLLGFQGTLKGLLQHYSSKASILRHSAFFTVQLSHPYLTTGKTIALTRQTLVGKVMYLLLNMLSRLVITLENLNYLTKVTQPTSDGDSNERPFESKACFVLFFPYTTVALHSERANHRILEEAFQEI